MIRVLENYSIVKTLDFPVGVAHIPIANLQEVGTYTISFTYVVHYGGVESEGFLLRGSTSIGYIPPSEGRISFTFEVDASNIGLNLLLYSNANAASARENYVTFYDIHIARGTQGADIWTPAEADLTPEQIAMLPPYGDYKEIKAF